MNKLMLLLSISVALVACSSTTPSDENTLQPGIMQAVEGSGAVEGGSWLPEIKQTTPSNIQ